MVKVKAKRTIFTVCVDGENKQYTYDSQRKPTNRDLLSYITSITGEEDLKIVSRETFEILLTMPIETFYEFCDVEYEVNRYRI